MAFLTDFLNSPEKLYSFLGAAAAISIPLFVNTIKDFYFDFKKRSVEKNYIVVQLIYLLDDFVFKCGEVSWDMGYDPFFPPPNENDYSPQTKVPDFDLSSVKGDQKYLEPMMLYRLQGVILEMAKTKEKLREFTNHPEFGPERMDDYFTMRRREYAEIGLKAAKIVKELRLHFKIPQRDDWNPSDTIIHSINQMNRLRAFEQLKKMERKARRVMEEHCKHIQLTHKA
ncbi:hypothetical protein [Enterobacter bugandensis]|uniref:hypothetical protein n=1 Tax=Enterobacter bugandensis TaxID=881260 RepID=UPI0010A466D4|nr:hypothetical protein [Enterobacter bugandensis]QCE29699.1 hypothetical protein FAI37_20670 [Enterobacter bugandensis]HDR2351728.1 hypothetical protein [Enterobacter asburiae]